ncbi:MAG: hypothetical protein ACR2NP_03135 [Pirellulaceae bacterium]
MLKRLRVVRYLVALTLLAAAVMCSGCAMNDGYSSAPGYGGGGGSC